MANPGHIVALRTDKLLKLSAYWIRLQQKTARVVVPVNVTMDKIRTIIELRDAKIAYENPKSTDFPVINDKNWPNMI